jgi:iron complex outermembrane receptor protein
MNVRPLITVLTGGITALLSATASFGAPLEEIVTYAERRSSDVQDVPVAVSTFTSDEIDRRQITGTLDLIQNVPNMSGSHNVSLGGSNSYFLRGIGNAESIATFDVPIGTYIDEIYISRQNQNQVNLIDIDRLEVLRGPQGTLFGRNTTGGAVVVVSQKPTDEFFATVEGSIGSYERYTLKGAVNAPISDRLLTQFSVYGIDEDGWMDSVTTGETYNGEKALGVRGAMRFIPSDTLTWDLSVQYSDTEVQAIGVAASPVGSQTPITGDFTKNFTALGDCTGPGSDALGTTVPVCSFNKMESLLIASNIEWQLDLFTLNFITGYYDLEQNYSADFLDNSPDQPFGPAFGDTFIIANNGNHDQISQEIKITGDLSGGALRYVGGVFYMDENNTTNFTDWVGTKPGIIPFNVRTPLKNTTQSAAVYGQLDLDVTDKLTLLAGGRWTDEEKDFSINGALAFVPVTDADLVAEGIPLKQSEQKFTYKVGGNYQFTDDVMAYLTYATGFKSGGWNARGSSVPELQAFGPEEVASVEAGLRAEWFDNRLRTNITAFQAKYDDIQIATVEGPIFITTNAGDTTIDGLELEITGAATDALTLYGNLGMMNGEYTRLSQGGIDASIGPEPTRMPEMTALVGAEYTVPREVIGGEIFMGGQASWADDYFMGNDNAPNTLIEAHTLVNAQVGWRNDVLDLAVECKNCFDETWFGTNLFNTLYTADPVRWNLRVKYRFE